MDNYELMDEIIKEIDDFKEPFDSLELTFKRNKQTVGIRFVNGKKKIKKNTVS